MEAPPPKYLIAIVEREPTIRYALESLLMSAGFAAEAFASAEAFLGSTVRERTGCLILDVELPGMSGLELQQHLVAIRSRIPIIVMTARPDAAWQRARAMRAGAVAFLLSPFTADELLRTVLEVVRTP